MRYMILIYSNPAAYAALTQADYTAEFQEYMAFNAETQQRGVYRDGMQLQPLNTATTVRVREGKTMVTDGPFAETKEFLAGVYVLDCVNLDEAIELSAKIPGARHGSVEIRPIAELGG